MISSCFVIIGGLDKSMITKYYEKLREMGVAPTAQRANILKSLQTRTDHPDVEAVHASLRAEMPALSLDTVYRTLNMFSAKGLAKMLPLPTHRFRFEGNLHEHDHFLCTHCEVVVDVDCSKLPHSPPPAEVKAFGEVYALERVYLGVCHACAAREAQSGGKQGKYCSP